MYIAAGYGVLAEIIKTNSTCTHPDHWRIQMYWIEREEQLLYGNMRERERERTSERTERWRLWSNLENAGSVHVHSNSHTKLTPKNYRLNNITSFRGAPPTCLWLGAICPYVLPTAFHAAESSWCWTLEEEEGKMCEKSFDGNKYSTHKSISSHTNIGYVLCVCMYTYRHIHLYTHTSK